MTPKLKPYIAEEGLTASDNGWGGDCCMFIKVMIIVLLTEVAA